ncbi:MAG: ATP-binding protein [Bacteroidales bacterium]
MPIKIALILSVILQFAAAIIALSLVKRTRTNIAWWLISGGFLLMAFRRVFEILQVYDSGSRLLSGLLSSWTGVLISVMMLLSLVFIKRIFNIQKRIEELRKQNESRVLSAILKTEEKERQHFSKELHDGLGPLLSSVKMAISAVGQEREINHVILLNAEKLIDESIDTIKEISNKLSPHVLTNFGLYRALKSFIQKLKVSEGPSVHFNCNLEGRRYSFNIEVVLYRVVCELISNSLNHASAKNIYIDILQDEHFISLKYMDDGIGFNEQKVKEGLSGLGYSNIRSRINSLDGTFDFHSGPGEGVQIVSRIRIN